MRSMTGFGRGQAPLGASRVVIELRTLNHRFLDIRLRLAPELCPGEEMIERTLRARFSRGRLEISAKLDGESDAGHSINRALARRYLRDLEDLRQELGLTEPLSINVLAAIPEVFQPVAVFEEDELAAALTAGVEQAIEAALAMRGREGEVLLRDLEDRLSQIDGLIPRIRQLSDTIPQAALERLKTRLARLLEGSTCCSEVDEARLTQELALLADRCDINEELTRLESHLAQFRKIAAEESSVGRRLEFLLQEMAREASTMGAKAQHAGLQHLVVDLRGELARMREQIQNVE